LLVAFGLGNPGKSYDGTRHNIGKEAVSDLARRLDLRFEPGEGNFFFARDPSRPLVLVLPTTYMNHSGRSALDVLNVLGASAGDLLAVCDDFNLPLGSVRIKPRGSEGGHNGLASIIFSLGSQDFPRLRMGIGPLPADSGASDFVLAPFSDHELESVAGMTQAAGEAVLAVADYGIDKAMTRYNKRPDE
jgi:PTH1 family peptidyl-tRNA hydrolase